jgi:hypothetical protein
MQQGIKVNGCITAIMKLDKAGACNFGQTVRCTRAIGRTGKLTEKVGLFMRMVMCMTDTGKTIRRMDMVCTSI